MPKVRVCEHIKLGYNDKFYFPASGEIDMDAKTAKMYKAAGCIEYIEPEKEEKKAKKKGKQK